MQCIEHNGEKIYYIITRRGTKNLYARMDENRIVRLSVPHFVSNKYLKEFVIQSYFKLLRKKQKKNDKIVNDGKIKILSQEYEVENIDNLNYLLTSKLKEFLKDRYIDICSRMSIVNPPSIVLKRVKGYLGQYNKKSNKITLNILIAHLDKECIEYVIVHELVHIKHMNHQQGFWSEVEKFLPNYKKLRSKCKKEFVYYENY